MIHEAIKKNPYQQFMDNVSLIVASMLKAEIDVEWVVVSRCQKRNIYFSAEIGEFWCQTQEWDPPFKRLGEKNLDYEIRLGEYLTAWLQKFVTYTIDLYRMEAKNDSRNN